MRRPPTDMAAYFRTLVGSATDGFLELRFRVKGGYAMRSRFFGVGQPLAAGAFATALASTHDVFAGCVPRQRKAGGKDVLRDVSMLWVDCDDQAAVDALGRFRPAPSMVVRSSERGAHAYWQLAQPVAVAEAERGNRRLAHAIGGCRSAVVNAAAILRPPETLNHKYDPPVPVRLLELTGELFEAADVVGELADPPAGAPAPSVPPQRDPVADPLLAVAPREYVRALFGLAPRRDGKLSCPFHSDSDPSFHCYPTAEEGWYCFGCGCGGDVYTLGELKFGIPARRAGFFELREKLYEHVLPGLEVPDLATRR
jgi:CHC2 zinc finger